MKRDKQLVIASAIVILGLGLGSCAGSGGGGDEAGDRSRITLGAWTTFTLSADVETGSMTDRSDYVATVPAGTYVVEYRNLTAGAAEDDFVWYLGAAGDYWAVGNEGQRAGDAVALDAGDCWITVDNDGDAALSGQFRLALLSDSAFVIPNEGSESSPIALTVGDVHQGKVGLFPDDGDYDTSWYTFTTGAAAAGDYEIAAEITNASTSNLWIFLYSDAFATEMGISEISEKIETLDADTTYYFKISELGGDIRPTYDLTVTAP